MGWGRGLLIGDRAFIVLKLETDIFIDYSGFYSRPEFLTRPHHKECFSDYCMNLFWTREEEGGGGGGCEPIFRVQGSRRGSHALTLSVNNKHYTLRYLACLGSGRWEGERGK